MRTHIRRIATLVAVAALALVLASGTAQAYPKVSEVCKGFMLFGVFIATECVYFD